MADEKTKPSKKHVESRDFRTVFVNAFGIRFGDTDVSLMLSAELADQEGVVFVQDEVRTMLTPRGAKVLSLVLNKVITEFEKANGPIPVQEGKEEEIASALIHEKHKTPK